MNASIHVVLVEDDPLLRDSLACYLRLVGFPTTAVGDCLSLYSELAVHRFDVAVIDLGLPDQAGEVLVDYLRRNTDCVIIVITARDTLDTRVECYRVGADLFLGKPVDGRELAAAITSLAARRTAQHTAPQATPVTLPHAAALALSPETPAPKAVTPAVTPAFWAFAPRQRILISPAAQRIELTAKEAHLLALLTAPPVGTVARHKLLEALYQRQDDSADRALDSLVRRTRHTIEAATGSPAPILTEHSVGYLFAASVVVEE
jgi:DNA-binding response OmpR family regulator